MSLGRAYQLVNQIKIEIRTRHNSHDGANIVVVVVIAMGRVD